MERIRSKDIFEKEKLNHVIPGLIGSGKNLLIFGLPGSGKSTLIKEICKKNSKFITLKEEEILTEQDLKTLRKKSEKLWCVGHQYPSQNQEVSEHYLKEFARKMGITPKKWVIARIIR